MLICTAREIIFMIIFEQKRFTFETFIQSQLTYNRLNIFELLRLMSFLPYVYTHGIITKIKTLNISITLKVPFYSFVTPPSFLLNIPSNHWISFQYIGLLYFNGQFYKKKGIINCLPFFNLASFFSLIILIPIYVINISSLFLIEEFYSTVFLQFTICLFIHLLMDICAVSIF